jgi:hypothetical protein
MISVAQMVMRSMVERLIAAQGERLRQEPRQGNNVRCGNPPWLRLAARFARAI